MQARKPTGPRVPVVPETVDCLPTSSSVRPTENAAALSAAFTTALRAGTQQSYRGGGSHKPNHTAKTTRSGHFETALVAPPISRSGPGKGHR